MAPTGLYKSLPDIIRWLDDDHYLQRKEHEGSGIFVSVEAKTGKESSYVNTDSPESVNADLPRNAQNGTISPDGKWIAYSLDHDLWAKELASGRQIRFTRDGSPDILNGYAAWIYYEEMLGRSRQAFWWSPDSKHLAFMRFDETQVPIFSIFGALDKQGAPQQYHYPQAGQRNPAVRLGIVSVLKPAVIWADFDQNLDQYFGPPLWVPDGSALWAQWIARNQQDLKIFEVDPGSGNKKLLYEEKQKTWVNPKYNIDFLEKSRQFIMRCDTSGWDHLYLYDMQGRRVNQITSGQFGITSLVRADESKKTIYFLASKENEARTDLYKIGFDGKGLTRLTFGDYTHEEILLSPHAKYFISTYSNCSTPPCMALLDTKGNLIRKLGDSRGENFGNYQLANTKISRVKTRDGLYDLQVMITYPLDFDSLKKYPVLIEVYGGPGLGNFRDQWDGDPRTQWWASEGLIQMTMDYRSSGHFGKKGMNFVYRQLGLSEMDDFTDCTRWLRGKSFVDTTKICFSGYSFGGFMASMAITYGAETFTHAVAYYPVTDWSLYDSYYTERFMGAPKDNPDGYLKSSPLYYAPLYKGLLRIVHGTADDNVHIQNSIELVGKLQDLNKNFEMMIYPGQRHGRSRTWTAASKAQSTHGDYKFIYDQLLGKPMPDFFWK